MELFSSQISYRFQTFFLSSQKKTSLLGNTPIPRFPLKRRLFRLRSFHLFAHFGARTPRRNSLRIKLTENPPASPPFQLQTSDQVFDVIKDSASNLDACGMEESDAITKDCDVIFRDAATMLESKSNVISSDGLFEKLENWVNTYKQDVGFYGVGTGPILTIYQGLDAKVERVSINNDEIRRRLGQNLADMTEVNSKISHAKSLAEKIESGHYVLPKNSSIAKFVVPSMKSGVFDEIRSITLQSEVLLKISRVGVFLFFVSVVFWMVRKLQGVGDGGVKLSELEKEMLRRKMKARKERDMLEKGNVVVIQESMVSSKRPQIDKQEVMKSISKAELTEEKSVLKNSLEYQQPSKSVELETKIQEIRDMARHVRKIEAADSSKIDTVEEDAQTQNEEFPHDMDVVIQTGKVGVDMKDNLKGNEAKEKGFSTMHKLPDFVEYPESIVHGLSTESASVNNGHTGHMQPSITSNVKATLGFDSTKRKQFSDAVDTDFSCLKSSHIKEKSRIIRSVKEAKEYLSGKRVEKRNESQEPLSSSDLRMPMKKAMGSNTKLKFDTTKIVSEPLILSDSSDIATPEHFNGDKGQCASTEKQSDLNAQIINPKGNVKQSLVGKEHWTEEYLEELKPFFEKIQVGFKDNFALARENVNPELYVNTYIEDHINEDDELEWMKDDNLRKIVYQVRENELAGRDAFFDIGGEEKITFFKGLEEKVEKANKNMLKVHEWIHSNIENVDYGADGISLYDQVEKIIPRWKGAPIERDPEFLSNYMEQRKTFTSGKNEVSHRLKEFEQESLQKSKASQFSQQKNDNSETMFLGKSSNISRTLIESSDGSVKAGKKSGKEYWQHTKKWSREFLEVYNAESDAEIKTDLRNMGKDLDRWITKKEIKEAGDLMDGLQKKQKEFIETKIHKLKREMANFGPQAVVNKYRDYAQDKEEDYLWWLDLPFVLCIELYMQENGDQRSGLYTLEMASDLELNPKPLHVIAFEDPGDCKNLCYIIQAHLKMLGNGFAFALPQPPKDMFRAAKENGAGVTVIRKGELDLNVDQPLEEVEEQITELGSKIYHDQIMRGRSVDLSSLMKGVFGVKTRKRLKSLLKKRTEGTRQNS